MGMMRQAAVHVNAFPWHINCRLNQKEFMKGKYLVAAGLAIIGAGIYFWLKKKSAPQQTLPEKENERHHLTNVFSKAKKVAVGN